MRVQDAPHNAPPAGMKLCPLGHGLTRFEASAPINYAGSAVVCDVCRCSPIGSPFFHCSACGNYDECTRHLSAQQRDMAYAADDGQVASSRTVLPARPASPHIPVNSDNWAPAADPRPVVTLQPAAVPATAPLPAPAPAPAPSPSLPSALDLMSAISWSDLEDRAPLSSSPTDAASGAYGVVLKATYRCGDVAVKLLYKQNLNAQEKEDFCAEVTALMRAHSPHVVQFIGYCVQPYAIVTELMDQSLDGFLASHRTLTDHRKWCIALSVAKGVAALHLAKPHAILHRDLKAKNVLVNREATVIRLCDLGFAKALEYRDVTQTMAGTRTHMAPEMMRGELYGAAADIFSFACVLFEIQYNESPWDAWMAGGVSPAACAIRILRGHRPELRSGAPSGWTDLIARCWASNPDQRPDIRDIVKDVRRLQAAAA